MSIAPTFELSGALSRQPVPIQEPLIEGRRYRVWLCIASISQGSVCVWVGGNRTPFFTAAGDHVAEVVAGEGPDVTLQGLNAVATVSGVAVREASRDG